MPNIVIDMFIPANLITATAQTGLTYFYKYRIPILMTSQTAPDWQLQIGESGASSRYNFNLELERL
jgi:hypothetical protein